MSFKKVPILYNVTKNSTYDVTFVISDISSSNQGKILIYSEFFSKMMKYHQTVIKSRSELKVTGSLSKNSKVTSILDKIPKTKDAILINQNWLMGNPYKGFWLQNSENIWLERRTISWKKFSWTDRTTYL